MARTDLPQVIPGAILAGGQSRRMGRDKATIMLDGRPLALHIRDTLHDGGCRPIVIVGRQPSLLDLGLTVLANESSRPHPLTGVIATLEYFTERNVLFCPVDLPALRPRHIRELLSFGRPCVASANGGLQPLLCVLGTDALPLVREVLDSNGPVHSIAEKLPRVELPTEALTNWNAPADFQPNMKG